jgi:peptide chain release factor 3
LQLEVLQYRLIHEYGADLVLDYLAHKIARWVSGPKEEVERFLTAGGFLMLKDHEDNPVALFENEWSLNWQKEKYPNVRFSLTMNEHARVQA